jgi:hypothetical protein
MLLNSCLTSVSLHYADYLISIMQHLPDRLDVSQFDYVLTPHHMFARYLGNARVAASPQSNCPQHQIERAVVLASFKTQFIASIHTRICGGEQSLTACFGITATRE